MSRNTYNFSELPFDDFQKLGVTYEQLAKMPKALLRPLLTGEMTQHVALRIERNDGECSVPARLRMVRDDNGRAQLRVYPIYREVNNDIGLTKRQLQQLRDGKMLVTNVNKDGHNSSYYVRLDHQSNCIIRAKVDDVAKAVPRAINGVELGRDQVQRIREGNLVELAVGNQKITAGVDLHSPTGFRMIRGDAREWERQQKIRWDMDNPCAVGYWQTTENGWQQLKVKEHEQGLDRQPEQAQPKREHRGAGMHI